MVSVAQAARYLEVYIRRYRHEYQRFTAPAPAGGGYPALPVSPYLNGDGLECHLATDGAVVLDTSYEPPYDWHVAGGPTLMPDFAQSRTPKWVTEHLRSSGLLGKNIGIYRLVSQGGIPPAIWAGNLGEVVETHTAHVDSTSINVYKYPLTWRELIRRLTFGALDLILDIHLPSESAEFWNPIVIRDIGFAPADRQRRRFFHYAELLRHIDDAAWDERAAWARAHVDLRRDFAWAVSGPGGSMAFTAPEPPINQRFYDRLEALRVATDGLQELLRTQEGGPEAAFHDYLLKYPVLIDVYGQAMSKPRLIYPPGESPLGKQYVEPDFIVSYWNRTYKLVELERPGHEMATRGGHPKVAVTHAAFQIAEWKDFIQHNYDVIRSQFPGISSGFTSMIVIGRRAAGSFETPKDKDRYIAMLRQQLAVEEIYTYDDLVLRAREAMAQLVSLSDSLGGLPSSAAPE